MKKRVFYLSLPVFLIFLMITTVIASDLDIMFECLNNSVNNTIQIPIVSNFSNSTNITLDLCDLNNDKNVTPSDYDRLMEFLNGTRFLCPNESFDFNRDGVINREPITDYSIMNNRLNGIGDCPKCDINNDSSVNAEDKLLLIMRLNNITNDYNKNYTDDQFDLDGNGLIERNPVTDYTEINDCLNGVSNNPKCDINRDGSVDVLDKLILIQYLVGMGTQGYNESDFDIDGNGLIERYKTTDYTMINDRLNGLLECPQCDINRDGSVNALDKVLFNLKVNGGQPYCDPEKIDLDGNGILEPLLYNETNSSEGVNETNNESEEQEQIIISSSSGGGGGGNNNNYEPEENETNQSQEFNLLNNNETNSSLNELTTNQTGLEESNNTTMNQGLLSMITGNVIGTLGDRNSIMTIIFVVAIVGAFSYVSYRRSKK